MYPTGPNRTNAKVNRSLSSGRYLNGFTSTQKNEVNNSLHTLIDTSIFKAEIWEGNSGGSWGNKKDPLSSLTVYQKLSNRIAPIVKH